MTCHSCDHPLLQKSSAPINSFGHLLALARPTSERRKREKKKRFFNAEEDWRGQKGIAQFRAKMVKIVLKIVLIVLFSLLAP